MIRLCAVLMAIVAAAAALAHPGAAIAVHPDGRVFFVDTGGGVYAIERNGRLARQEGPAFHWFALDQAGRFRRTPWPHIPGGELRAAGAVILSSDVPVAIGGGTFYFPEAAGGRVRIVGVTPAGARSVRATLPPIKDPWINGLAAGPGGSLYYTEDRAVRKIDARGRVTTVATIGTVARCAAIPGIGPELRPYLRGLAVAPDGTVYVAASGCGALLKIDPRGAVAPLLRTASPWAATDVAVADGEVFVLEYLHTAVDDRRQWLPRVRKIARDGSVVVLATIPRR